MSGGNFNRIGIPIGLDSTIREDIARIRAELEQGVASLARAAHVPITGVGPAAAGAPGPVGTGGSYNPAGSAAVNQVAQAPIFRQATTAANSMQRQPFDVAMYRAAMAERYMEHTIDRRGVLQESMGPENSAAYHAAVSREGIRAATQQHNRAETQRIAGLRQQDRNEDWYARDQQRAIQQDQRDRVRDQERQNRDEGFVATRDARDARRADSVALRMELAQQWSRGGRARVLEAHAERLYGGGPPGGPGGPGGPEHSELMARAQEERNRGFFGMPGGRMIAMQAMFGAWEAGRALQASGKMHAPLAMNADQVFAAQNQALQMMQGGIYGSIVGGGLEIAEMIGGGTGKGFHAGRQGMNTHFWEGFTTPAAVGYAQHQAQLGLMKVALRTATNSQVSQVEIGLRAQAAVTTSTRDPLQRREEEIEATRNRLQAEILQEGKDLAERAKDAWSAGDEAAKMQSKADIEVYNRTGAARWQQIQEQYRVGRQLNDEEVKDRRRAVGSSNYAMLMASALGDSYEADMAKIDAEMGGVDRNQFGRVTSIGGVKPGDDRFQGAQDRLIILQNEAWKVEQRRDIAATADHQAAQLRMSNRPVEARITQIVGARDAALFGKSGSAADRIRQTAQDAIDELLFEAGKEDAAIGRGLGAEQRQIGIMLGEGAGAGASRSTRAGIASALSLADAGRERAIGLEQAGHGIHALNALSNTQGLISLRRQEYLENIRGEEFDFRNRDVTNTRDTEDAGKILDGFRQAGKEVTQEMERILQNVVV